VDITALRIRATNGHRLDGTDQLPDFPGPGVWKLVPAHAATTTGLRCCILRSFLGTDRSEQIELVPLDVQLPPFPFRRSFGDAFPHAKSRTGR